MDNYVCPECGTKLVGEIITTNPPMNRIVCPKCGWKSYPDKITFPAANYPIYASRVCKICGEFEFKDPKAINNEFWLCPECISRIKNTIYGEAAE